MTHSRNPPRPSPYISETYGKEKRLTIIEAPTRSKKLVLKELRKVKSYPNRWLQRGLRKGYLPHQFLYLFVGKVG